MPDPVSPFHPGELALQDRAGVRELMAPIAPRFIRDHMPEQHMAFYAQLPFLMLGSVDEDGDVWATLATGAPGFVKALDPYHLQITAHPPQLWLKPGLEIGVLGIALETRRRNRLHGVVSNISDQGFTLQIRQTFGNCPKYIQRRDLHGVEGHEVGAVETLQHFDDAAVALLSRADTLFIASAYHGDNAGRARGVDVSHRGGKPGFIKQLEGDSFIIPDFPGNNFFNTLGNILEHPKAGVFIPDFESGDVLFMTGEGEVILDSPLIADFKGAQRLLKFTAKKTTRHRSLLPFTSKFGDYSPVLERMGAWSAKR